jgi:hypothetical protein
MSSYWNNWEPEEPSLEGALSRNCRTCLESPLLEHVGEGEPEEPVLERIQVNPLLELGTCAGILKLSMGARNRVGIVLSYRPAWLHSVAELVPWNRILGSLKV